MHADKLYTKHKNIDAAIKINNCKRYLKQTLKEDDREY